TLKMINRLVEHDSGVIRFAGEEIRSLPVLELRRRMGYAIQSIGLFPHWSVAQNIATVPQLQKWSRARIDDRIDELMALLGLEPNLRERYPHQLSGGQRQRVALARSLAKRPKLLLLDEPMGALDKKLRDRMQLEVVDILERVGVTCVMVTHDQEEAMTMAGRIAIMNRGKFVQIGEPEEIYEHPTTRYSAEFIGSVNVFEGVLKERQEDGLVLDSPGLVHPLKVDADASVVDNVPVHVALRPEKIMLCEEPPANGCNFAVGEVIH
ncbi:ATP-binding cassette domain-containing protein, partial [Streptococcus danieliae]|nr:ATP-binding cassette domain-containing protein [Streptococcus danieliae]